MLLNRRATSSSWSLGRALPLLGGLLLFALLAPPACLERPVTPLEPKTSNQFVDQIRRDGVDKIDLLFMIDNSMSMADKQAILKQAVPVLLQRLVTPACVDENKIPIGGTHPCAVGTPEFSPIQDIHIGVVTSNIGDMSDTAASTGGCKSGGDKGQLIATPGLRPEPLPSWNGQGFLAWDPDVARPRNAPPGMTSAVELATAFEDMVAAAGEKGCGYEAVLESWYRFLIDPEPPKSVQFDPATYNTVTSGIDDTVLAERAKFLRPDSLVAVIMLSDENDCSLLDYQRGSNVAALERMPRATSACARDLNDACCLPCDETPPAGCPALGTDPACLPDKYYSAAEDHPNLRCFEQKRRFGRDFLQPLSRYVDGLTQPKIYNRRGELVPNPLFAPGADGEVRDKSLVYLAGITGVPWQDVADRASLSDPKRLRYLNYAELEAEGRWEWMLGKDGEPPLDSLMVESPYDRTDPSQHPGLSQTHPAAEGGTLAPATATSLANPINGHESNITDGSELQFACIFPLTEARDCVGKGQECDCGVADATYNRALCQGTTQTHAKAFPGTRQLEVLRSFGKITQNSIVASICPKITRSASPASDPNYGYNPAVSALVDRLKERFGAKCLPRPLKVDNDGQVPCVVIEARRPSPGGAGCGPCDAASLPGRQELDVEGLDATVRHQLRNNRHCGGPGDIPCESYCLCEVEQFEGNALQRCRTTPQALTDEQGYCYVDETLAPGESPENELVKARLASVAECPATQRRLLRFSNEVPAKGAVAFIACLGSSLSE